jgi:3-oxoacyl-(acyl-carrier-protein) synthase
MSQRRVVVTGLGATTPLGGDVASTWAALIAGKSGVRLLTEDWRELLPVHFAARVATEPADQMVSACASGAEAIGYALEMIRSNRADVIVSGGVEAAIHQLPLAGFAAMKALSTRNDAPERASRPYDADRDGFVLGEGGGILILEEYEHAKARGAKIYCELVGQGLSSDGYHIAAPDPDGSGVQRAIKFALKCSCDFNSSRRCC